MFYAARRDTIAGAEQTGYAAFEGKIELLRRLLVAAQHDRVRLDSALACHETVGHDDLSAFDARDVGMGSEDHAQRHDALHPGNDIMGRGQVVSNIPVA